MIALMAAAVGAVTSAPAAPSRMLVPIGDQASWFRPGDYPPDAIARKADGVVHFAVAIGSNGKPRSCRITKSSGDTGLDGATCRALMARASFHPLVDANGKPATATFEQFVRWTFPIRSSEQISDHTFTAHAVIGPAGNVVQCTMTGSAGTRFSRGANPCGPFGERGFLSQLMGKDYAKARSSDVRLQVSYEGQADRATGRTPDFYLMLAEAEIAVEPDGSMSRCTSVRPLEMQGRTTDLCAVIANPPPRFRAGAVKKRAVFVLDLSASYR